VINNRDKKVINAFGAHLRKLRLEKGLSQEDLTDSAGLSKNMIGMIERGEVNPTLTTIEALARGLNITKAVIMNY
jgi:transcriptional regulator with XRE-family HTH domain